MSVEERSIAAATAVVGNNLMQNSDQRQSGHNRRITHVALAGSAAAGDTIILLKVGSLPVARIYNKATGFPTDAHRVPVGSHVPANSEVGAEVLDAPVTNPINIQVVFAP